MSVSIRNKYRLKKDVMSYSSASSKPAHNTSFKLVPGYEVDRSGRNSKLIDGFRKPNPFEARYYNFIQQSRNNLGFDIEVQQKSKRYPNDPRYNFLRREGLWYEYPAAVTNQQHKGNHRDRSEMESIVIAQSYNQLKDSPVHLGMFLAELGPTLSFIAQMYRTFSRALRLFRRGRVIEAAQLLVSANAVFRPNELNSMRKKIQRLKDTKQQDKDILNVLSSKWLELQFAWGPLLQDIQGLIEIAPHLESATQMPRVTGRRVLMRSFDNQEEIKNVGSTPYGPFLQTKVSSKSQTTVLCRTDWTVGNPNLYMLSMLGLVNPLEVVWDKIPFSFVIDWFIPIGTWISAMTADTGLNYLGGSITTASDCEVFCSIEPRPYETNSYEYVTKGNGSFLVKEKDVLRGVFTSAPSLRLPPLRYPSTLWHAVTGSALLYQTKDLITSNLKIR